MEVHPAFLLLLCCSATASYAHNVAFSSLNKTLIVSASPTQGQALKAGVDQVTITWAYNQTLPSRADSNHSTVEVKLCYAPVSQINRDDRKTDDNLDKDKTCPFDIAKMPYNSSNNSFTWTIPRDIPTATYFVRVYAINSKNHQVGYGQTTDALKTTNLFQVDVESSNEVSAAWPIIGGSIGYRHAWLIMLFLV